LTVLAGWQRALECTRAALDRKAYDLAVLETGRISSIADYFVICNGRSDTQVQAIAEGIEAHLARQGCDRCPSKACRARSGCSWTTATS